MPTFSNMIYEQLQLFGIGVYDNYEEVAEPE